MNSARAQANRASRQMGLKGSRPHRLVSFHQLRPKPADKKLGCLGAEASQHAVLTLDNSLFQPCSRHIPISNGVPDCHTPSGISLCHSISVTYRTFASLLMLSAAFCIGSLVANPTL